MNPIVVPSTSLVLLAALDDRGGTEALDDGAAQRLAAVDDPQADSIGIELAFDDIAQQRAHHARAAATPVFSS